MTYSISIFRFTIDLSNFNKIPRTINVPTEAEVPAFSYSNVYKIIQFADTSPFIPN